MDELADTVIQASVDHVPGACDIRRKEIAVFGPRSGERGGVRNDISAPERCCRAKLAKIRLDGRNAQAQESVALRSVTAQRNHGTAALAQPRHQPTAQKSGRFRHQVLHEVTSSAFSRIVSMLLALIVPAALALPHEACAQSLTHWRLLKEDADAVSVAVDETIAHTGKASARVTIAKPAEREVAFVESIRADEWRGKRVLIAGYVRVKLLGGEAGLAGISNDGGRYSFYFPSEEKLTKAGSDWRKISVALEVPADAMLLSIGVWVRHAHGDLWLDDLTLTELKDSPQQLVQPRRSSPLTRDEMTKIKAAYDAAPENLENSGFEQ